MLPTSGRYSMPFACHAQDLVGHASAHLRFASTVLTALAIIGNRFKPEASGVSVLNDWMRRKAVYAKDVVAVHRRASTHKLTRAGTLSSVLSID